MRKIFFIVILLLSLPLSAATYYVAPPGSGGSNSNPGTLASPWLTLTYAESQMIAGDTCYIRAGTYNEQLRIYGITGGTAIDPTVFMNYNDEEVIIDGTGITVANGSALVRSSNTYCQFIGIVVRNINWGNAIYSVAGILLDAGGDYNEVLNCTVYNSWGGGISSAGDYTIIDNCIVYDVCENNNRDEGRVATFWGGGISARRSPKFAIIRNCIVHDIWGEGISTFEATHTTIEDNIIYNVYSAMLYVSDATDCLVQRNLVYQTRTIGINSGICLADEKYNPPSARHTVINNIVYGCYRNFRSGNETPLVNTVIANNTFVNSISGSASYNVQIGNTNHTNSLFANNIIMQEDAIPCILASNNEGLVYSNNLYNKSYDADAVGAGDVIGDPDFTETGGDPTASVYYQLAVASDAIDAGIDVGIYYDYALNLRDATPDIGAYEYDSPAPPTYPTVFTGSVIAWTRWAVTTSNLVSEGEGTVTAKGVCWATDANPDLEDSYTDEGAGTGYFNSSLTGLTKNTTYHYRAYATNETGTVYGSDLTFTTPKYVTGSIGSKVGFIKGKRAVIY